MTTLSIILKKGKRLKYIELQGNFIIEKTSFSSHTTAELQYKFLKDRWRNKGWNTYIKNKPSVSSNFEHTKVKKVKILGRYVRDGTVGGEE